MKLAAVDMPTKYGNKPRPAFEIVGWDDAVPDETAAEGLAEAIPVQSIPSTEKTIANCADMDDEIPF